MLYIEGIKLNDTSLSEKFAEEISDKQGQDRLQGQFSFSKYLLSKSVKHIHNKRLEESFHCSKKSE